MTDNEIISQKQIKSSTKSNQGVVFICESQQVYEYCKSIWTTSTIVFGHFSCMPVQTVVKIVRWEWNIILLYQYVV